LVADPKTPPVNPNLNRSQSNQSQGAGLFTVQVASARSSQEAHQIVANFKARNFEAYFYEKSRTNFPVRVGRYQTQGEAEAAKMALTKAGAKTPYVSKLNR
jgi:septal ring-binding cell division protein DamX